MQFTHSCLSGTWTSLKIVFDDRNHFSIKLFSVSMHLPDKEFISTNNSIHLRHRHFLEPFPLLLFFFSCCFFPPPISLFISSEISFSGNLSLRNSSTTQPLILYSVFFTNLKKNPNKQTTKNQKPNHRKPKQNKTYRTSNNKQTKLPWKKLFIFFKLKIILWRLNCNTGSVCYCRIICKDYPAEQKLHKIRIPLLVWNKKRNISSKVKFFEIANYRCIF